jgi:hypothetical protein
MVTVEEKSMSYQELLELVFTVAKEMVRKGPGWAQQRVVLGEVANRVRDGLKDEQVQQRILTCWHDLFRQGRLSWGYNINNPDAPFYHIPEPENQRDGDR